MFKMEKKDIRERKSRLNNYAYNPNNHLCLECLKEFDLQTDIILCEDCMKLFDTDKLWELHDKNKLDILDFNENEKMREQFRKKIRTQTITLENGIECIINHSSKHKCEKCKKEILWALIPIELVSLAKWDLHKCPIEKIIKQEKI